MRGSVSQRFPLYLFYFSINVSTYINTTAIPGKDSCATKGTLGINVIVFFMLIYQRTPIGDQSGQETSQADSNNRCYQASI